MKQNSPKTLEIHQNKNRMLGGIVLLPFEDEHKRKKLFLHTIPSWLLIIKPPLLLFHYIVPPNGKRGRNYPNAIDKHKTAQNYQYPPKFPFSVTVSFKIFMLIPLFGHSHVTFLAKIADILTDAGHDVVSLFGIK